ncbi:protein MADS AFFECTING FLOWERING 5-like [Eucalyptus grandis]|uniref:protein MADS AFFECTING FLOWERING 5-like n=1 Tax=Eucalyptus grandis TaxID=71139 RepID=UPI00192EB367|nr:protein MADS AFFECTING FLOWERING 5-like [Eucalyptus grandis]
MGKRRRTEIAEIADPAARLVTYSKRRKGLFNKASQLCRLCGARAAVVVFSPAGKPCSFGEPSADEIVGDYLRHGDCDGDSTPPMGLTQWGDWMETEWEACATEEDLEALILKYEAIRDCARRRLKSLEEASRVEVREGESRILSEEEIDALFESLGRCPALSDLLTDGDGDGLLSPPENSADGGGSPALESIPALSDLEGRGSNAAGGGSLGAVSTPTSSDLEDHGFDPEELLNLLEDGDLEDHGFDPDGFLNLLEDSDMDSGREGSLTSPEDSAVRCGYNPNDFVGLEDLDVLL